MTMKTLLLTLLSGGLLFMSTSIARSQATTSSSRRPVYEPLKPASITGGLPASFSFNNAKTNLFDYPEGSVLYILNGKEQVDKAEFMSRIKQSPSGITIHRVAIGQPDANQKRIIRVDYARR